MEKLGTSSIIFYLRDLKGTIVNQTYQPVNGKLFKTTPTVTKTCMVFLRVARDEVDYDFEASKQKHKNTLRMRVRSSQTNYRVIFRN